MKTKFLRIIINFALVISLIVSGCKQLSDSEMFQLTTLKFEENKELFERVSKEFVKQKVVTSIAKINNNIFPLSLFKPFLDFSYRYYFELNDNSAYSIEISKEYDNEIDFWNGKDIEVRNHDTMTLDNFLKEKEINREEFLTWIDLLIKTNIVRINKNKSYLDFINEHDHIIAYNYTNTVLEESNKSRNYVKKIDSLWYYINY